METILGKEQFLIEHNKLAPKNLQATFALLTQFQVERKPFLKDADWSFKLRIPFISWLMLGPILHPIKKKYIRKSTKRAFMNYPETHNL